MELLIVFISGILFGRVLLTFLDLMISFFQNYLAKTANKWESTDVKKVHAIGFDTSSYIVETGEDGEDNDRYIQR